MSARGGDLDDNKGLLNDGPVSIAPERGRRPEHRQNPADAAPGVNKAPPPDAPKRLELPWKRKKRYRAFAGDVAAVELRTQLARAPDRIAGPALRHPVARADAAAPGLGGAGRLISVMAVAATGAVGYFWGQATRTTLPSQQLARVSDRMDLAQQPSVRTSNLDSKSTAVRPAMSGVAPETAANAARDLTSGATSPAVAHGASAPQFNGQGPSVRAPARQLTVDAVRLRQADTAEIALMIKNGAQLMANADIAGARLIFQRAAE